MGKDSTVAAGRPATIVPRKGVTSPPESPKADKPAKEGNFRHKAEFAFLAGKEAVETFLKSIYPESFFADGTADSHAGTGGQVFVTLTYAQSVDAKIGVRGRQLILSGPGSMKLTHRLRAIHNAILVGIGTVLNEDPSLTCEYFTYKCLCTEAGANNSDLRPRRAGRIPHLLPVDSQPQPYILDSHARLPPECKLIRNARHKIGKAPCIVTLDTGPDDREQVARTDLLRSAGCHIMTIDACEGSAGVSVLGLLTRLPPNTRLMVEGGSSVISSYLSAPSVVDRLVITTAPTLVGNEGVAISLRGNTQPPLLHQLGSLSIGQDTVIAYKATQASDPFLQ